MKQITLLWMFIFIFAFISSAQNIYSVQNLKVASIEELNEYLVKAQKQKKTGTVLSIAGPSSALTGLLLFSAAWSGRMGGSGTATLGSVMFVGGIITTLIGVPVLITGTSRVKKVHSAIFELQKGLTIDWKPSVQYNLMTLHFQPAITFRISF